ncbi:M20 metallopeptidase family protein [Actinomadura sp. 3N407]|uniref:M20 metallopeptidase family protein n=1 Tax=Actinomadura sp. 3N407 TaxID=3457423 RepID=UPI003FCE36B1
MFSYDDAATLGEELTALRRDLHREPEIGLDLPRTQERVLRALDGLPLEISTGKDLSSVTAVLRGGRPGPAVLLRADMDALPLREETGVDYASQVPGAMHACGHDLHIAGLVGAARLLAAHRGELAGDVVFMFQPGEEGYAGAKVMIDEGLLDAAGREPAAAYALHVFSTGLPAGFVMTRPGAFMPSSDTFDVRVVGKGGHGSAPHLARDPIPPLCDIVTTLQTRIARSIDPLDPAVVTVGKLWAGTIRNVIPEDGNLEATVRTFSEQARKNVRDVVLETVEGIAAAYRVKAEVDYQDQYPVTVNAPDEARFALETAEELFEGRVFESPQPLPGSEDFSYVLQQVPGAMLFLSACPPVPDPAAAPANHSAQAVFDDSVLPDAALLLATLAARRPGHVVKDA